MDMLIKQTYKDRVDELGACKISLEDHRNIHVPRYRYLQCNLRIISIRDAPLVIKLSTHIPLPNYYQLRNSRLDMYQGETENPEHHSEAVNDNIVSAYKYP